MTCVASLPYTLTSSRGLYQRRCRDAVAAGTPRGNVASAEGRDVDETALAARASARRRLIARSTSGAVKSDVAGARRGFSGRRGARSLFQSRPGQNRS